MNNEEKFKKSLQDKIASKEFPFDEGEWEKAAAILDNSRKGGNRTPLFLASGIILFLATLISVGMMSDFKAGQAQQKASPSTLAKVSEKLIASTSPSDFDQTIAKTEKTSDSHKNQLEQEPAIQETAFNSPTRKINSVSQLPSKTQNSVIASNLSSSADQISENTLETNSVPASENSIPSVVEASNSTEPDKLPISSIPASMAAPSNHAPMTEALPASETIVSVENETTTSLNENPKENQLTASADEKALLTVSADTIPKIAENQIKSIHNILTFELGAAYMFGWKNADGRDASGLNAVVGINYSSLIAKQYWFSIGIQYTSVRNLSYSSKTSKVTRYRLGEESDVTTITPSTLYYLNFPFKLHYQLDSKQSFGLGYTANYLFNVESKVETYTQKLYTTEDHQSYTTGGYTEGFKLISSQLGVYYRRELIKDLSLNAEFVFGLNDIKENSFFNSSTVGRNTGIKLTLTYNLFKH